MTSNALCHTMPLYLGKISVPFHLFYKDFETRMDGPFHQFDGSRMNHSSPMIGRHRQQDVALKHKTESEKTKFCQRSNLNGKYNFIGKDVSWSAVPNVKTHISACRQNVCGKELYWGFVCRCPLVRNNIVIPCYLVIVADT